ncbi:MFS transporter [Providencia manganoxydans]|uniref:MFS transporter n=1 Tax=Providencia manganoxydans TaxID=2923283 RepID=UPI002940EF1B|nr:MFS transporter [Providencia stuartii]ELR5081280.1 MFS transporter [Providencia stuartii]
MKWRFRLGAALGNTLEYYDVAVFAAISMYLSAELERLGYSQATEMVWGIFALRFIIRPVGGYMIGRYADRAGKKSALILTSFITGTATLCMALLPIELLGAYTPMAILVLQMALSFSFAGEFPSLVTYLLNSAKDNERSLVSALASASSIFGVIISLGLVFALERILDPKTMQSIGWRIPLLLGVVNILISFWFRAKLPNQPHIGKQKISINWSQALNVFLLTIPGTVIFYSQNISLSLILEHLEVTEFKSIYGVISSSLLLIMMILFGYLTDKYSMPSRVFNLGVMGMVILSVPLYFMMSHNRIELIIISQLIITVYSAMILCNSAYVFFDGARENITTLSVGFNFSCALLAGVTPLFINYLVGFHLLYIGVFLSLCGVSLSFRYYILNIKSN